MSDFDWSDARALLQLRDRIDIAHHLPGRIRLRLRTSAVRGLPRVSAASARALLQRLDFIHDLRVNAAAGSVVIDYDPVRLPPAHWETLLAGDLDAALPVLRHWLALSSDALHELKIEERT